MKRTPIILLTVGLLSFVVSGMATAVAQDSGKSTDRPFYRYVDRNGVEVFTDDLSRIPAKYRSSAKVVELPPAVRMPASSPPTITVRPSFTTRLRKWVESQPAAYRVMILAILPTALLSLWVLKFLQKLTDVAFVKIFLRLGMLAIVISTAYLCYFIYLRVQAERLGGTISVETETVSSPRQRAEDLKKDETDRLKVIEDTVNQK
ncbi:MAG TPA: hypothetical protein VMN77_04595 [Nitrospiria bacterium]|nr:hypothetical protein [Nitrospiria bacterium]